MELKGKTAVVTGAGRGIGRATAELLLEKGMRVAGWGRRDPEMGHADFRFIPCDLRDPGAADAAMKATQAAFGSMLEVLINNAGVAYSGALAEMNAERWREMFDVNVHGIFYCVQAALPALRRRGGHIINVASIAGKTGIEFLAGYSGTKFAVRGISEALFKELRPLGVKVTCVCPGSVRTDLWQGMGPVRMPANPLSAREVAEVIVHCLETGDNCLVSEVEVRPFRPQG